MKLIKICQYVCGQGQEPFLEWSIWNALQTGRLLLYQQTRLEKLARDKHASLLQKFVTYNRKNLYNIGPWTRTL